MWCITDITPEFRERMYNILDLYALPYDPKRPVIGFDEKPKQLLENRKKPIPMKPGQSKKCDHQYKRRGYANIYMAVEFKAGKRTTRVTSKRGKNDFAKFIRYLVDKVYPKAECLQLVMDNLNIHTEKTIYDVYSSKIAKNILNKIKFHYTPVHASWLNVAEIEIGVMDTECTKRRIPSKGLLKREVEAWTKLRNKNGRKINWKFTKERADKKLSKYYVT
jgi:hypothetical protein